MNVWVVIPAFNEETTIKAVVQAVCDRGYNVVVVDDASSDNTFSVASQSKAIVLEHLINRGQGASLKTGIVYALERGAEEIVTFDADGQHEVNDIEKLLEPLQSGNVDVVLGSRFLGQTVDMSSLRGFILKCAIIFTRVFSHINVTDTHNGLRAMTRHAAMKIKITQDRFAHASEILDEIVQHKFRYTEVPVTVHYTDYSRAKGQNNLAMFKIAFKFLLSKITR